MNIYDVDHNALLQWRVLLSYSRVVGSVTPLIVQSVYVTVIVFRRQKQCVSQDNHP